MKPADSILSPPPVPPAWHAVQAMHAGRRDRQEDAIGCWQTQDGERLFAVVADGAGGHGGGAEAAAAAVEAAALKWPASEALQDGEAFLTEWMNEAHLAVQQKAQKQHPDARTVAVALLVRGSRADWVHAGDCRLYHFRQGRLLSRTRDDSVVQVLFEQGEISEAAMGDHADQNRLLQAIGGKEAPTPRKGGAVVEPGDVLLLCSDGFWERTEAQELTELSSSLPQGWQQRLEQCLQTAVQRGGDKADNASVVLCHFSAQRTAEGKAPRKGNFLLAAVLLAVAVAGLIAPLEFVKTEIGKFWQGLAGKMRTQETTPPNAPQTLKP